MLVVDSVLPGGPAEGRLQPGDVLVRRQPTQFARRARLHHVTPPYCHAVQEGQASSHMQVAGLLCAVALSSRLLGMLPLQVRLRGAILTSFLPLETALDDAVGEVVALDIERAGKPLTLEVAVQACNCCSF